MSPSEAQLRAALREGAGRGLDADAIIAKAERYRRARRQRLINGAAAAAVVCVFVGGGSWLAARTGDEQGGGSSGSAAHGAARTAVAQPPAAGGGVAAPSARETSAPSATAPVPGCPPTAKPVAVPDTGTTGRAAALLPTGLSAITACGYSPDSARLQHSKVFTGATANGLAARLNRGSVSPVPSSRQCSTGTHHARRLVLFATAATGARPKTVQVTVRCTGVVATNGAVARYLPDLPRSLSPLVR